MKVGIAGSRSIRLPIPEGILPENIKVIISGGAIGIDKSAEAYASRHGIFVESILPEYELYGRSAPIKRNDIIIKRSDIVYVFWDGKSRGSYYVIDKCRKTGKPCKVYILKDGQFVLSE